MYFRVPIDVSLDRLMARRVKLKFYEAGMDMGWSTNPLESFRHFQGKVLDEYDRLVDEFGLERRRRVAAASPISSSSFRKLSCRSSWRLRMIDERARRSSLTTAPTAAASPGSYYGHGIPYLPIDGYPGKLIAIEGTDGVGRITQIQLLREWLEVQGYGVDRNRLDAIAS